MALIQDLPMYFKGQSFANQLTSSVNGGIAQFATGGLFSVNHGFTPNYQVDIGAPTAAKLAVNLATLWAMLAGYGK